MKAIALLLLASVQAIRIDPVPINTRLMQIGFVDESDEIVREAQQDSFLPPCDDIKKKDSTHGGDCAYPPFYAEKSKVGQAFVTEKHPESGEMIPISVAQKPEELVNKENAGLAFPVSDNSINGQMVPISVAELPTCDQYLTGSGCQPVCTEGLTRGCTEARTHHQPDVHRFDGPFTHKEN